jgi:hypothetical protein
MYKVKDDYLFRAINRAREKSRPPNAEDISFEIDDNGLPEGFIVCDVYRRPGDRKRRHILCYTYKQVRLLATSQRSYMDRTFKTERDRSCSYRPSMPSSALLFLYLTFI